MRYFLRAAGRTFHVGSSKVILKLFMFSGLPRLVGFGEEVATPFGGGVDDDPVFWGWFGMSSICCGDEYGDSRAVGLTGWSLLNEGFLRIDGGPSSLN